MIQFFKVVIQNINILIIFHVIFKLNINITAVLSGAMGKALKQEKKTRTQTDGEDKLFDHDSDEFVEEGWTNTEWEELENRKINRNAEGARNFMNIPQSDASAGQS